MYKYWSPYTFTAIAGFGWNVSMVYVAALSRICETMQSYINI